MSVTKKQLIEFEKKVKKVYEAGKIKAPVHLSGNNEDILIEIFIEVDFVTHFTFVKINPRIR